MRIAMLAPLYESVPPQFYGGTERVVSYLTEELVRRGHRVTLFAAGGSRTSAELVEVCPSPLNFETRLTDPVAYHFLELGLLAQRADEFDLIHSHCDFRALPFASLLPVPVLSTSHNRLDTPECRALSRAYPDALLTALSRCHQQQLPSARWAGVCYNGVPVADFPFSSSPGGYLAFAGRLSPEKGPIEAIEVAERTGIPLRIAAKINPWEQDYFEAEIQPRLRPPLVEYVGELDEDDKRAFLRDALALLFPICWPEPFGMVVIEAMATGTPVLALPNGAALEVVVDGVSGFLCADVEQMASRAKEVEALDRTGCRAYVDAHFSDVAMTDRYEAVYRRLIAIAALGAPVRLPASSSATLSG